MAAIEFIKDHYVVNESNGQVNLEIGVISGTLQRDVTLNFFAVGLDASGTSTVLVLDHFII